MKYRGRISLLFLSFLTSVVFFIEGDERGTFFFIFSFFHACFSWVFGSWFDKLQFLAGHDPLTGVFNRRYAYKAFENKFSRAKCRNEKLGILNIDVDHFKSINDTFGHAYGDFVLKQICDAIQTCIGKRDILVRWGGDEFLVLFLGRDMKSAEQLMDQIHESMQAINRNCPEEDKKNITVSIGFSLYPDDANSVQELIVMADERMYQLKKNRN